MIVNLNQLNLISLAVDFHIGLQGMSITNAQNFLLAAGAVFTRGGLKNANLNNFVAACIALLSGLLLCVAAAAGAKGQSHRQHGNQCQ